MIWGGLKYNIFSVLLVYFLASLPFPSYFILVFRIQLPEID